MIWNSNSVIWNSINKGQSTQLERIQNKFLRLMSFKVAQPMNRIDHNYNPILMSLKMKTLNESRDINDLIFLHKIENKHIKCRVARDETRSRFMKISSRSRFISISSR